MTGDAPEHRPNQGCAKKGKPLQPESTKDRNKFVVRVRSSAQFEIHYAGVFFIMPTLGS
jgi:hypothetical protein